MKELRIAQSQVKLLDPEYTTDQPDLQTYSPLCMNHFCGGRIGTLLRL